MAIKVTNMIDKPPFLVLTDVISPMMAETITDCVHFNPPDELPDEKLSRVSVFDEDFDLKISTILESYLPKINNHFGVDIKTIEPISIEKIQTGAYIPIQNEGYELLENKWCKTKPWDFTAIIFLTSVTDDLSTFDDLSECYGGKLEFFNFRFGFNPMVGTMVVFPTDPRFCNATSLVSGGELFQIRCHLSCKQIYIHDPKNFPGTHLTWFR